MNFVFNRYKTGIIFFTVAFFAGLWAEGSSQVATLTHIDGKVEIFSHPSKTLNGAKGPKPRAFFENEYFSVREAKVGDRVDKGNILRTMPEAKAKVIYDNGDHMSVGPGSAYRIFWKGNQSPEMSVMYGRIRGIVSKKGPRNRLRIRTKSATMGVRGTDFHISDRGARGGTKVSVLRGSVALHHQGKTSKPLTIQKGYSAEVAPSVVLKSKKDEGPKTVTLRKTTKKELLSVHRDSKIVSQPPASGADLVKKFEQKATDIILADIKEDDPKHFEKLKANPSLSHDMLNTLTLKKLFVKAPEKPSKPFLHDLEKVDEDAYDKYFDDLQ